MKDGRDDEPQPGPSQPPILGLDPTPWMDDATMAAALARPQWGDDRSGVPENNPFATMNVNQFLTLPRDQQEQIFKSMGDTPGVPMSITPWDSNDPANAPDLQSKLWYAAPETSRGRYLDPQKNIPDVSFSTAMLGARTQAPGPGRVGATGASSPDIPFGQGRWEQTRIPEAHDPVWRFNRLPRATLEDLVAQGRMPTELGSEPQRRAGGAPIFGTTKGGDPRGNLDGTMPFGSMAPAPPAPAAPAAAPAMPSTNTAQEYIQKYQNWLKTGRWEL
jgi:hypothetical protein